MRFKDGTTVRVVDHTKTYKNEGYPEIAKRLSWRGINIGRVTSVVSHHAGQHNLHRVEFEGHDIKSGKNYCYYEFEALMDINKEFLDGSLFILE